MFCSKCGAAVQPDWIKCPSCQFQLRPAVAPKLSVSQPRSLTSYYVVAALVGAAFVLGAMSSWTRRETPAPADNAPLNAEELASAAIAAAESSTAAASSTASASSARIKVDRFVWEKGGGKYCKASGKITNTSSSPLSSIQMTTDFLKDDTLISSDWTFTAIMNGTLAPGTSVTWSQMYECPIGATRAEISAVAGEEIVTVDNSLH